MIRSKGHLEYISGFSYNELKKIAANIGKYYLSYDKEIKSFGRCKTRHIIEPKGKVRHIQNRLKDKYFAKTTFPNHVQGGVRRRNHYSNALQHIDGKYFFVLDIKDFFGSVNAKMVNRTLLDLNFSPDLAHIVTKLITFNNQLPKGSPTSPYIANLALHPLDKKMLELVKNEKINYTRFIDDLSFSSTTDFRNLTHPIVQGIFESGFAVKREKINYSTNTADITGIKIHSGRLYMVDYLEDLLIKKEVSALEKAWLQNYRKKITKLNKEKTTYLFR